VYVESQTDVREQGVIFCDLATAIEKHPDLVREYFQVAVPPNESKFAALHSAFWSGGVFLYVPAGVQVEVPFRNFVYGSTPGSSIFAHTLIVAEEEASVVLVDHWKSETTDEPAFASNVVEIHTKEAA